MGLTEIKTEAQEIISHMRKNNIFKHVITTSDSFGSDRSFHQNFLKIANELRKKGYKVTSSMYWNSTEWEIKI